jgi:hypothetical protein
VLRAFVAKIYFRKEFLIYINVLSCDRSMPMTDANGIFVHQKNATNMTTLKEKITELNQLVLAGKALDAFEKFYHPDVVMQENENAPTVSKEANRKRELEFFANITEFRGAQVKGITTGEDISTVIWHYDYTHKEWGVRNYTQVSVQHWKDGLIIKEQFFYGN